MHTQVLYTDSVMSRSIQSCIKAEKKHGEGSMGEDFQTRLDRETGIIKPKKSVLIASCTGFPFVNITYYLSATKPISVNEKTNTGNFDKT